MSVDLGPYLKVIEKASKKQESRIRKLNLTTEDLQAVDFNKLLSSSEEKRMEAIEDLSNSSYPNKLRVLLQLLQSEPSFDLRNEIRRKLNEIQSPADFWGDELPSVFRKIREDLQGKDLEKAKEAIKEILNGRMTEMLDYTLEAEKRFSDPFFRLANVRLISFRGVQFAGQLLKYLKDSDEDVVLRAIEAIGLIGGDQELFHLFSFLNHSRDRLRKCAHSTLQILGKDRLQNLLDKMSRLPKKEARRLAIQSIRLLSFVQGVPVLKRLLTDREELVSQMAAETLRAFGHLSEPDEVPVTEEEQGDPGTDFIRISDSIKKAGDPALISSLLVSLAESDGSGEEKLRIYMSFLNHEDDRVRANALEYMAPYIPEDRLDFYIGYFADPNNRIRGNAILALARNRKLFREHESYVNNAIESLVKDSRPFYKLTALYCIGILHHPGHLNMVTELQECSIAAVSAKAEELLNSWEKINPGLISQARSAHSMIKARPEAAFLPEKMEEKRKFIQKSLTDPSPEVRMEFLNKLCELEPDPSLSSIVLPFFSQERLPQALGLFIDALHHHGLEDRWYHFKGYLKSNDSRILLSAYKALVDVEGFPVMTQLETFIHSANLSEGRNAEILAVCLPRLVVQNRQIALKTMQRLSEGNEKCLRFFAESLYLFKDPPPVLHRHAIEVLSGAIEVPTLEKCGEYLLKNLDTDTLTGRVKNLIQKSRYAQQKEFLENLLDKIAEKKASMRRI